MAFLLQEVPENLRPRERFYEVGCKNLSDVELLALVLRTGLKNENVLAFSQRLLIEVKGLPGLKEASVEELMTIKGVGEVKAIELKAIMELGCRLGEVRTLKKGQIISSFILGQALILEMKDLKQEHLVALYLNTKNELIKKETLFIGSLNQSIAHPREIFKHALKASAASIILVHNHPSGHTIPSSHDISFTKRIVKIGELMGIKLLDHLIIGEDNYLSMEEENILK